MTDMVTKFDESVLRDRLLARIERLLAERDATRADRAAVTLDQQSVGRLSRMDALQQQAMAQATQRRRDADIARAQAALLRMDDGEFGYCLECGDDIAPARLSHDPALPTCLTCSRGG